MKRFLKFLRRPSVAALLIAGLVLCAVLAIRGQGWLQRAELIAYDRLIRMNSQPEKPDERIAIVGMTEEDLVKYGHPLNDATLARLLELVASQEPCVIGLDLYRDLPEPRDRSQSAQLEHTLRKLETVIAIERIPTIKPPPALADLPERIAANNLPKDYTVDGLYRRAPIFIEPEGGEPQYSFALALASAFLASSGVDVELGDHEDERGHPVKLLRLGKTPLPRLSPDAGGYVGLPVRDYEVLLDFRGPRDFSRTGSPRDFTYSFGDVLEGRVKEGELKGKIVLIGTVMDSVKDNNPTPISENLRGISQHALIVNQLLRAALNHAKPMRWWTERAEIGWIAIWTLAGAGVGLLLRSPWKFVPGLALLLSALATAVWLGHREGIWLLAAAPGLGCAVSATVVTSYTTHRERMERRAMRALFSKHVSPKVADALWAEREQFLDGGRLRPQRLVATVLFTDLKGFSTTSEKMDPVTLMDWMNEYMDRIALHVDRHGGMVNKYIGDAIMAVFGAPAAQVGEEDVTRNAIAAVECALEMRRELAALNAEWKGRGLPLTSMRVGIHTGPLVAGSLGSAERLEFTVLGDTVNTAARLESAGKDAGEDEGASECTILVGDPTFQRLGGRFAARCVGPMSLKGKADKIIVHSILGRTPTSP